MDLTWEAQTISGYLTHDAGPSIDELWLSPRADLSAGFGPWRVRFRQAHLPQISHCGPVTGLRLKLMRWARPFWPTSIP
jgi:hypothetical protein